MNQPDTAYQEAYTAQISRKWHTRTSTSTSTSLAHVVSYTKYTANAGEYYYCRRAAGTTSLPKDRPMHACAHA